MPNWTKNYVEICGRPQDIKRVAQTFFNYFEDTRVGKVSKYAIKENWCMEVKFKTAWSSCEEGLNELHEDFPQVNILMESIYECGSPPDQRKWKGDEDYMDYDDEEEWVETCVFNKIEQVWEDYSTDKIIKAICSIHNPRLCLVDLLKINHFPLLTDKEFLASLDNIMNRAILYGRNKEGEYRFVKVWFVEGELKTSSIKIKKVSLDSKWLLKFMEF